MLQLDCYHQIMNKLKFIFTSLVLLILLTNCETVKQKTDAIIIKENQKLSKFIGKSIDDLKIELGKSNESFKNEKGNLVFVYNTKKYGIPCERRFETDSKLIVIGFISNGCF